MKSRLLFALSIALSILACKKKGTDGPSGPIGPAGPTYKGVIKGYVSVYDQYGGRSRMALQDVQLTLSGGRTISPDSNGFYSFDSVLTGNYSISAVGLGVAPSIIYNVQFIKDTLFENINLSQRATFALSSFTAYHRDITAIDSLIVTFDRDNAGTRALAVFAGNSPDVSNTNYKLAYISKIGISENSDTVKISQTELNNAGISSGQIVYYAVYPYASNDYSAYADFNAGRRVYSAVGSPVTDTTIAP